MKCPDAPPPVVYEYSERGFQLTFKIPFVFYSVYQFFHIKPVIIVQLEDLD